MLDNVVACRERLFTIWETKYKEVCKKECHDNTREAASFILSRNIVCGNALSMHCVDENCNDTAQSIVFSEWTFVTGSQMQRKDYSFDDLLMSSEATNNTVETRQRNLFTNADEEGKFLKQYISDYRRVQDNG